MPSKLALWKYVLDSELRNAGGVLHVSKLKAKMVRAYRSHRSTTQTDDCLGIEGLALIPDVYLSRVDPYVRLPPTDAEIVRARRALRWHCEKFQADGDHGVLLARYRRHVNAWASAFEKHSAEIMKHAVHVAAWFSFADIPKIDVLQEIGCLLEHMLKLLRSVHPIPRLRLALHHVSDRLHDLGATAWVSSLFRHVDAALGRHSPLSSIHSSGAGKSSIGCVRNRTDQALVREVLGHRQLPPGYRIQYQAKNQGRKPRWIGRVAGSDSCRFSANLGRFTETGAIEHVYRCLMEWHASQAQAVVRQKSKSFH